MTFHSYFHISAFVETITLIARYLGILSFCVKSVDWRMSGRLPGTRKSNIVRPSAYVSGLEPDLSDEYWRIWRWYWASFIPKRRTIFPVAAAMSYKLLFLYLQPSSSELYYARERGTGCFYDHDLFSVLYWWEEFLITYRSSSPDLPPEHVGTKGKACPLHKWTTTI